MLNKKRVGMLVVLAIIGAVVYNIYILNATNGIMEKAEKVAAGEIVVEGGTPYDRFSPLSENIYTEDIKRYFAYCGIKKGKIFITCVNVVNSDEEGVQKGRDWLTIEIEKTNNGEWEAVGTSNKP